MDKVDLVPSVRVIRKTYEEEEEEEEENLKVDWVGQKWEKQYQYLSPLSPQDYVLLSNKRRHQ